MAVEDKKKILLSKNDSCVAASNKNFFSANQGIKKK
jgi:hypothetical protein